MTPEDFNKMLLATDPSRLQFCMILDGVYNRKKCNMLTKNDEILLEAYENVKAAHRDVLYPVNT